MFRLLAFILAFWVLQVRAEIPEEYQPIIIKPPFSFSERLVDLTAAVDKANLENKPLYIYLGAEDCPPCRTYKIFLSKNHLALKDAYERVILVDIRTWLKGPDLVFKVGEKSYSFTEFNSLVGDTNKTLTYPYFWLISPVLKQLKQLPQRSGIYLQVEKQLEILRFP